MPIVLDPLGTPEVHFYRDGIAVLELIGDALVSPTEIPAIAGKVIVKATTTGSTQGFIISEDFQIGEVVEIYPYTDDGFQLFPPSGESFFGMAADAAISGGRGGSKQVQKISSTEWTF